MKLYFLPYHKYSGSVRELRKVLGGTKLLENGNYAFSPNHLVVNWGAGSCPYWGSGVHSSPRLLNHWTVVSKAVNKLHAFKLFKQQNVPTPDWTDSRQKAEEWIAAGRVVICRTLLSAMEGKGIVVAENANQIVNAPLYTKLFSKHKEYRVHVFKGQVIDYVQKKLSAEGKALQNRSKYIRNTANGWIFARTDVVLPTAAADAAKMAIAALGLDFGAVDLATSETGRVAVFEVNTAPGLEGTTIQKYSTAIAQYKSQLE